MFLFEIRKVATAATGSIPMSVPSPDAEIYGFGQRFRENRRHFYSSTTFNTASAANENQKFLDNLGAKLSSMPTSSSSHQLCASAPPSNSSIPRSPSFNGIVGSTPDRSSGKPNF